MDRLEMANDLKAQIFSPLETETWTAHKYIYIYTHIAIFPY